MNIIRRQRATWTTVDNRIIGDRRLSMKAMGLLVFMLSKPNNWEFSQEAMGQWFGEGREAMRSVMRSLGEAGYIKREVVRGPGGQLRTLTIVSEEPDTGFPTPADPAPAEPTSAEPPAGQAVTLVKTDAVKTDPVKTEEEDKAPAGPALPRAPAGYQEALQFLVGEGVPAQCAVDWLRVRAKRRAPFTDTAWSGLQREAKAAGLEVADAVQLCAERGWQSLKAEWVKGTKSSPVKSIGGMNYNEGADEHGNLH